MKKLLFYIIIAIVSFAFGWFIASQIIFPLTAGIIGYFDQSQDLEE